jgi:hypothetical protein
MTRSDWPDIRERLARLAIHPDAGKVFGSRGHGWHLEPPLSAAELGELEDQLRVELPEEYRSFLLEAGRGGAGPAYGLFPVHRKDGRWGWEGDGASLTGLDTLAQPFPHAAAFNPADGLPDPPDEKDYDSEEAFNAAEDAYRENHDEVCWRPEYSVGLLYLCHLGCAYREGLVVTGPARGQMWADDTASDGGFRPLAGADETPMGFARWYRQWLDKAEAELSHDVQA